MRYKWRPSITQRREFAERMKDPDEKKAYENRKIAKADKRRSDSKFNYYTAGGMYIPTQQQFEFCLNRPSDLTDEEEFAFNMVMSGFSLNEKVHHDYIHIVNEKMRSISV